MENLKHTKKYAAKLALEFRDDDRLKSLNIFPNSFERSMFIEGYMKALEETAAPDLLEALLKIVYESNGEWFIGFHGDTNVTDIVINAINKATK